MADHSNLTSKEKKEIRKKRRELRRLLRSKGINSKSEFEIIAQQMGLVYGDGLGVLRFWYNLVDALGLGGIAAVIGSLIAALALVFGYSVYSKNKEDFTISLNGNLTKIGFDLSETEDFSDPQVRLTPEIPSEVNCISILDIPEDLDNYEGSHNSENYFAYTFWIRNHGEETVGYDWELEVKSVTNDIDEAVWIVIYDEGKQIIYAQAPEGHDCEKLVGYNIWPLYDTAANPDEQYYENEKGKGIATTPYEEDDVVTSGTVEVFEPEEKHKYTVVMWIEGDDPECTNDNLGGEISFNFRFTVVSEDGAFDDFIYDESDFIEEEGEEEKANEGTLNLKNLNINLNKDDDE